VGCRVVTRRNRKGNRDQDLALALARLEEAFGPVEVLQVRPNPRPAEQRRPEGNQARDAAAQAALDLDSPGEGVRRSPSAVDAR
jgi:hypothetical protein